MDREMNEVINSNEEYEKPFTERIKESASHLRPYLKILWAHRFKIMLINVIANLVILLYLLFLAKPYYKSTITILPDYGMKQGLGGLGGLASLAGVNVGEGPPTAIYEKILISESVLGSVIYTKYLTEEYRDSVNLIQYFDIELEKKFDPDVQERRQFLKAYDLFIKSIIQTDLDKTTGILDITITMPESRLSAEVANNVIESLDKYIQTTRKSNAIYRRLYLEKRNNQIEDSLRNAEEALKLFRFQNKIIGQSPELLLEDSRLQRKVELYQNISVQINQQLELARIEEIKDTPIVNLKEKAKEPVIKSGPQRIKLFIVFALIVGLFVGTFFAFRDQLKQYYNIIRTELTG